MSAVSGSPTQIKTSCATLSLLAGTPDDAFLDGEFGYVASVKRYFQLVRHDATITANGSTVLPTFSGNGFWVALEIVSDAWSYQPTWYIDPTNGNDENDGATSITALKTWAEFRRRVVLVAVNMTVNIMGTLTEIIEGSFQGYKGSWTLIIQGVPTVLATLTGTTFTNPVRSGAQAPGTMTSTDLANFTPYLGKFLRAGTQYVPILGISGGTAPVLPYWTNESFTQTLPANGTAVDVLELPEAPSLIVNVTGLKLHVKFMRFTTATSFEAPYVTGSYFGRFVVCDFACTFFNGSDTYLISCMLSGSGSFIPYMPARFIGGGSRRGIFHANPGQASFSGFIIYGATGVGLELGNANNFSMLSEALTSGASLGLGVFNSTGTGVKIGQGGKLSAQSLYGNGNGGYGFEINYGGVAWLSAAPTITGTSGDLQFCGAATAIPPLTAGAVVPVASALTTWAQYAAAPFSSKVLNYGNGTCMAGA